MIENSIVWSYSRAVVSSVSFEPSGTCNTLQNKNKYYSSMTLCAGVVQLFPQTWHQTN